jgi:hypothetical protein
MFPIPASVAANMETMIRSFLWFREEGGNKPCNVKWASVVLPKKTWGAWYWICKIQSFGPNPSSS